MKGSKDGRVEASGTCAKGKNIGAAGGLTGFPGGKQGWYPEITTWGLIRTSRRYASAERGRPQRSPFLACGFSQRSEPANVAAKGGMMDWSVFQRLKKSWRELHHSIAMTLLRSASGSDSKRNIPLRMREFLTLSRMHNFVPSILREGGTVILSSSWCILLVFPSCCCCDGGVKRLVLWLRGMADGKWLQYNV